MPIQTYLTTLRLDTITEKNLKDLIKDLNFNKSQVIRHSVRLLKQLLDIQRQNGDISVVMENGDKIRLIVWIYITDIIIAETSALKHSCPPDALAPGRRRGLANYNRDREIKKLEGYHNFSNYIFLAVFVLLIK